MASRSALTRLAAVATSAARPASSIAVAAKQVTAVQSQRWASTSSQSAQESQSETSVASTGGQAASNLPSTELPSPFEPALTHPRTHNHHVATLHLRAHGPGETFRNLEFFCDFALRAGYALGIPLSRTAFLPTRTSLWTVPKGPFVHKKSQENFQRRVHKRVIKVWDADIEVVDRWLHFLRIHCMNGVGMRAELYRHLPLSIGSTLLAASTSQLRSIPDGATESSRDATMRASDATSEQVSKLARSIIQEELAKQDAEDALERTRVSEPTKQAEGDEKAATAATTDAATESNASTAAAAQGEDAVQKEAPAAPAGEAAKVAEGEEKAS